MTLANFELITTFLLAIVLATSLYDYLFFLFHVLFILFFVFHVLFIILIITQFYIGQAQKTIDSYYDSTLVNMLSTKPLLPFVDYSQKLSILITDFVHPYFVDRCLFKNKQHTYDLSSIITIK